MYLCEECAKKIAMGSLRIERVPEEELKRWKETNDFRAKCGYCRKRDTAYYTLFDELADITD